MFNVVLLLAFAIFGIIGVLTLISTSNRKTKVIAIFCIIVSILTGTLTFMPEKILGQSEEVRIEEYELISLNLRHQIKGKAWDIISGYASMGEKSGYIYYYKSKEGGIRKGRLSEKDELVIYEIKDHTTKPKIQKIIILNKLGGPDMLRKLLGREKSKISKTEYRMFVPTGTIIREISI